MAQMGRATAQMGRPARGADSAQSEARSAPQACSHSSCWPARHRSPDLMRLLPRARTHARAAGSLEPEVSYLLSAQNADGGFGSARGQSSDELYTAWTAIGLA